MGLGSVIESIFSPGLLFNFRTVFGVWCKVRARCPRKQKDGQHFTDNFLNPGTSPGFISWRRFPVAVSSGGFLEGHPSNGSSRPQKCAGLCGVRVSQTQNLVQKESATIYPRQQSKQRGKSENTLLLDSSDSSKVIDGSGQSCLRMRRGDLRPIGVLLAFVLDLEFGLETQTKWAALSVSRGSRLRVQGGLRVSAT